MSQENVEIVRRSIGAFSRGDLETVLDDLAPEFEFHPSGRFMDTQRVYRGRAGFVEFWGAFRAAWEEITVSIERIEDLGDRVLTLGNFHGRGGEAVPRSTPRLPGSTPSRTASRSREERT